MPFSDRIRVACFRGVFFSCLFLLAGIATAPGQKAPDLSEPLEKYDDPPIFIFRKGISEATVSQHGPFTSHQVNVTPDGQNIVGDAANEPSITIDPTNPKKMAIGWRQFDDIHSNFRQAGWGYTSDGGATWQFPGVLQNNIFRSDPVLASDDTGRFFYLSLLETFFDDLWRSLNGGQSWTRLNSATGGDKQWFTIDNAPGSPGRGFQYQWWSTAGNNYNGRQFSRSTDGGFTWMNPVFIPNSPVWGTLDVNSGGDLFLGGTDDNLNQIWCVRSTNAKNAAAIPSFDLATPVNLGGRVVSGGQINPLGIVGQLFLTVDRSDTATNNNVYLLASVQPTGFNTGTDVMFVRSTDNGQSFSVPRRINDDPVNHAKHHWFGTQSVAPNGRIDVVWLDTRNAANNLDSQLFYSYSKDGGNTWSPNVAVSEPFNPTIGYPNQNKIGDYITIVSDSIGGNVAYTATFNGEQDIYYARVAPPPSLPLLNISTRVRVLTGERVLIGGFIITGTEAKTVLLRVLGPSLANFGVQDPLIDPVLELHTPDGVVTNDNWVDTQQGEIQATGIAPPDSREPAILATLAPGSYTAVVRGKAPFVAGSAVVEMYDGSPTANASLANISSRGYVQDGDNRMIAGVIVAGGNGAGKILVRGLGPSLADAGIIDPVANPTLSLRNANGTEIARNDNWADTQAYEVYAAGIPPANGLESALVITLASGSYTAILGDLNNDPGVGLIEVYNLR